MKILGCEDKDCSFFLKICYSQPEYTVTSQKRANLVIIKFSPFFSFKSFFECDLRLPVDLLFLHEKPPSANKFYIHII
jgi:hypothetical protein